MRRGRGLKCGVCESSRGGGRTVEGWSGFLGGGTLIACQQRSVAVRLEGNVYLVFHFDPYPFILRNLAFSTQAAYAAPLILLAGNRASLRDRMTLEHTAAEADFEEQQNRELLEAEQEILRRVEGLEHHILELERRILERLDALPRATG